MRSRKSSADNAEELARLLTLEQGKPLNGLGSRFEMGGAGAWARYTADLAIPVKVLQDNDEGRVELHRKPIGVVGSITPWNWPVMIAIWHIIPAIRTGNTVVIKPSPYTPLSTMRMVEMMNEVLPAGVRQCHRAAKDTHRRRHVRAYGHRQDRLHRLGRDRQEGHVGAAQTLKRLTLELGGNDAGIVLPDADPKQIARGPVLGRLHQQRPDLRGAEAALCARRRL